MVLAANDSPSSPEMMDKSQSVVPGGEQPQRPPRSPEMASSSKKKVLPKMPRSSSRHRSSSGQKPPLAPPAPAAEPDKSDSPPDAHHLHQLGSSEDLSFADFSNLEEEEHQQFASLSGFLETDGGDPKHHPGGGVFNRRKVSAVDVASVGNASDTQISVHNMSGRDLHERAKMAFNAGDYSTALPMFESILSAQVRRFSPLHPSVGAAMHNVGVRTW